MGNKLQAFLLRRAGAFSIYREGMDKQAVQTSIEILESAERPLVIFPEGHISRTNDRLTPLLEGTALIARQAAKRRAKDNKRVVVHPMAIRYAFPFDIESAAAKMLDEIEARLTWRPSRELPLVERFQKVGAGLLALKELQYLGHTQDGDIPDRIPKLIDAILAPMEAEWTNGNGEGRCWSHGWKPSPPSGHSPGHDQRRLGRNGKSPAALAIARRRLMWPSSFIGYPPHYVTEGGPKARVIETVERFEEDLSGKVTVHGPVEATITIGDAIEVTPGRESRGEGDPLMSAIENQLRTLLGIAPQSETAN